MTKHDALKAMYSAKTVRFFVDPPTPKQRTGKIVALQPHPIAGMHGCATVQWNDGDTSLHQVDHLALAKE